MRIFISTAILLFFVCPSLLEAQEYPWLGSMEPVPTERLEAKFEVPGGFTRVAVSEASYAAWLRGLPVRTDRKGVLTYAGEPISAPSAAVVHIDVGSRNLQQCADSVIRLHAEYHWQRGDADQVGYHFTSGDLSTWKAWRRGERFTVRGSKVQRTRGRARKAEHPGFRGYLDNIFRYAGTRSLHRDSDPVRGPLEPGDFFVQGGSPGHAVIVLDVATHPDGRRIGLVGQGFLPAQEFHVIRDSGAHVIDGVWFALPGSGETLNTPSWRPFGRESARRFTLR